MDTVLQRLIASTTWRQTTYIAPHEYIVERQAPILYRLLIQAIADDGYLDTFQGRTYRYLNFEGYRYWHMSPVINRARLPDAQEPSS